MRGLDDMSAKEIDQENMPWYYRLVLRLPKLSIEEFSEVFQGLFWVLFLPLLIVCNFFLGLVLFLFLPVPVNFIMVGAITLVLFIIFVKTQLERFINAWDAMIKKEPIEWNIDKTLQGYIELLQKEKRADES